jgi:regulator of RNase E activity RraA
LKSKASGFARAILCLGDIDGVLVVPREAGEEAFTNAIEKARSEKLVQKAIEESMSACEALAKFGVG